MEELLAPIPAAADYSVSTELWERLENEIKTVSARIDKGEELIPDDVANVRKLKSQVDSYVMDFNREMRNSQDKYKRMVEARLKDLGYDHIEQFIEKKKQEQSMTQNNRIACKMDKLKKISDDLLSGTKRLKDVSMSKELLPIFTARFPKVQSGAKNNDITDWTPYSAVMSRVINILDVFFCDPKYEDAALLPISSFTIRELLAYTKDGKDNHLTNIPTMFEKDKPLIHEEKLKRSMKSKMDGIKHIQNILDEIKDIGSLSPDIQQLRAEQAWKDISTIVRICNNF